MNLDQISISEAARALSALGAAKGGQSRSKAKQAAARRNGKKGGRPRKVTVPEIPLVYLRANFCVADNLTADVKYFRGIAFRSPVSGLWCSLRRGIVICPYPGQEVHVFAEVPVRSSWQPGLSARMPLWSRIGNPR